ncbi:MAG TPA: NfeD family protein [Allosphingosinicella sp.]|nr:NfeD family protein [Allosphingosinicella sp.]
MNFDGLDAHWWWLLAAALLALVELVAPGIFSIWIAAAAAATGLAVMALPIPLAFQLALFALLSMAAVYAGRRWYEAHPVASADPRLNDRTARLIGQSVTVVGAIRGGEGRVKVGDGVWAARGPDADEGARVRIVGAAGSCLKVEPIPELEPPAR